MLFWPRVWMKSFAHKYINRKQIGHLHSKIIHIKMSIDNELVLCITGNRHKGKWKLEYPQGNRTSKAHGGSEKKATLFIFFFSSPSLLPYFPQSNATQNRIACSSHRKNVDFTECHLDSPYLHVFAVLYSGLTCSLTTNLSSDTKFPGK